VPSASSSDIPDIFQTPVQRSPILAAGHAAALKASSTAPALRIFVVAMPLLLN
jgi:hypothetical protein